ncbi:MAG: biotin attachment protein, partial [Verrucomicrobia bacterium]|nr:biotin attachment protein [Cytophagales bacterium]
MLNLSDQRVADAIHKQHLHTLETLHTPKASKLLARIMLGLLLISLGGMFLPWQQNVSGYGEITALSVQDRPQSLQNAIPGMIDRWWVQEGAFVRKGDTILTIRETKDDYFDPQILVRLQEQVDAQDQSIVATQQKVGSYRSQIVALQQNQELSLQKARNKIRQARLKVTSDSVEVVKARNDYKVAVNQLERYKGVFAKGIISKTEFEARQLKLVETETKVQSAEAKLSVTRQEYLNALIELTSVVPDYNEKIAKAQSDLNATLKDVADADAKLSQLRNKYSSVKVRRGYYAVVAPQDGTVVRAAKAGIGETIKEGESIAVLQPSDPSTAVAVYIRA